MAHLFPLFGTEVGEDRLQRLNGAALALALAAHLQNHVALSLFHLHHRANGPAALGQHRVQPPGATDQAADGAAAYAVVQQQRAMRCTVLAGDAAQLDGLGIGVIQATDQVIDALAAGIHQQKHGVGHVGRDTHGGMPGLGGSI